MASLKEIALRREVELLWVAADEERSRANALAAENERLTTEIDRITELNARLADELDTVNDALHRKSSELESKTRHYAAIVADLQVSLKDASSRAESHKAEAVALLASQSAIHAKELHRVQSEFDALLTKGGLVETLCASLYDSVSSEVAAWAHELSQLLSSSCAQLCHAIGWGYVQDAVSQQNLFVERTGAHLAACSAHLVAHEKEIQGAIHGVVVTNGLLPTGRTISLAAHEKALRAQREAWEVHVELSQRCLTRSASLSVSWVHEQCDCCVEAMSRLTSQARSRESRPVEDTNVFHMLSAMKTASPSSAGGAALRSPQNSISVDALAESNDMIASLEKKLATREKLLQAASNRAESLHLQNETLQAQVDALQRQVPLLEAESLLWQKRHAEQLDIHSELKRKNAMLTSMEKQLAAKGDAQSGEDSSLQETAGVLKAQLLQQMLLLDKLQQSGAEHANAQAAALVCKSFVEAYETLCVDALDARQEWLGGVAKNFEEERLQVRSALIEAADEISRMERAKAKVDELIEGNYTPGKASMREDPFMLTSVEHLGALALAHSGASNLAYHQHAASVAAALSAMFLEVKLEFSSILAHSHRALLRTFWVLAPKERASSHVRVHILEGALAVSEAQRNQCLTVAQWLQQQCQSSVENLNALVRSTDHLCRSGGQATQSSRGRGEGDAVDHNSAVQAELQALKQQLSLTDRKAARDVQHCHDACDRLVDTITTMHRKLLESEMQVQHTVGDSVERISEVDELKAYVDRENLAHQLEQHIADDSIFTLRSMLTAERSEALTSLSELLRQLDLRNVEILHTREAARSFATRTHLATFLAQYCFHAFSAAEENRCDALVEGMRSVRVAALEHSAEVDFILLTSHWEYGLALLDAHHSHLGLFDEVARWLKAIQDENHFLRRETTRTAHALSLLVQQRSAEILGVQLTNQYVASAFNDWGGALHSELCSLVNGVVGVAHSYASKYFNASKEFSSLRSTIAELTTELERQGAELAEHREALASSAKAVDTVEYVLSQKLAVIRDLEMDLHLLRQQDMEHRSLITSLKDQLVVYHELLSTAGDEKQLSEEKQRRLEMNSRKVSDDCAVAHEQLSRMQKMLEEEQAAHRATIRSLAISRD